MRKFRIEQSRTETYTPTAGLALVALDSAKVLVLIDNISDGMSSLPSPTQPPCSSLATRWLAAGPVGLLHGHDEHFFVD